MKHKENKKIEEPQTEKQSTNFEQENSNKKNFTESLRENPWVGATIVLGVIILIFLLGNLTGFTGSSITGSVVAGDDAGQALLDFANEQGANAELVDVVEEGNFYKVTLSIQEQDIPIYVTKDGKYFTSSLIPLTDNEENSQENSPTTEVSKSDKPIVGLYIWSYCPYGVTALEPFAKVASLLEDYADFKVFLYYAGHGDFEIQQNKIQACIQELEYDAYWKYGETFATEIYDKCYGDAECDLTESVALMNSLGIDSEKVLSCVESNGEALLEEHYGAAQKVSVTGSPSLVVNGIKVNSARTAEAFKEVICSGFTTAPEECNQELDSTGTAASGSC
jgi:hypothetical protein